MSQNPETQKVIQLALYRQVQTQDKWDCIRRKVEKLRATLHNTAKVEGSEEK